MKKVISLVAVMCLALGTMPTFAAKQPEDKGPVFLSLTKTAEPLKDLTTNLTVITQEEIQEKNAKNLGEIVDGELGIAYKSNGPLGQTQSIFMRGAKSDHTLVLIDGRQVNTINMGGADFTAIPANMIERVEIIRGSGAAVYGTGAFGGVINVITKKATPFTPKINPYFSYGSFNTINAGITGAYANDKFSVLIAPSMLSSDGYRKNSFYDSKNIFGKTSFRPTEASELILSGQAYNDDIGNPGSKTYRSYTDKMYNDNQYIRLDYNTVIGEDFKINTFGFISNQHQESLYSVNWNNYYTEESGLKALVSYKNLINFGAEYTKTTFENKNNFKENREKTAGYLQGFINIANLTIIPAVRYEISNDYDDIFTPAISAVYKLNDEIKLSGNISRVWKAPTFNELYYPEDSWSVGNPNIKSEKGWSYDLGFEYSKNKFTGMLTGFYIDSEDLIYWQYNATVGKSMPENIDKARQYGYEIGLKYDICENISNKLNYTYTRAEDTKIHEDLSYRPMHTLNYAITVKPIKPLKVTADVSYITSTIYNAVSAYNPKALYLKDYCLLNIRADYQINKFVSLWAKCDNITNDDKYQLSYDYPMPGITGIAGFDIKF